MLFLMDLMENISFLEMFLKETKKYYLLLLLFINTMLTIVI